MEPFLTPDDPQAFVDWPDRPPVEGLPKCPKCKGHGGWNLRLYAYALPARIEDTPAWRHLYCHFRTGCSMCGGAGYTKETCDHKWKWADSPGQFHHVFQCVNCNATKHVDSSG